MNFQDVDLVIAPLTISSERLEVVDFSYSFWEEATGMLTLTLPKDSFFLFRPLEFPVWICYCAMAILVTGVVYGFHNAEGREIERGRRQLYHIKEWLFSTVSVALYQGQSTFHHGINGDKWTQLLTHTDQHFIKTEQIYKCMIAIKC